MAKYGARLVDNGYPILPLIPNSKMPGVCKLGKWSGYPDWAKHCRRPTKKFEIDIWERWPDAGIGLACGVVVGVDIDIVQSFELALAIEQLARKMLGDTPALRIGLAPKRMLFYRSASPFGGIKKHPVEIMARGQQVVLYGVHPETGEPYKWPGDSLADLDISQLPAVTEEQCRAFAEAAFEMVPLEQRPGTLREGDYAGPHIPGQNPYGTLEAIQLAMEWVPNPDLSYDEWRNIAMAIKKAVGDEGFDCFAAWSALSKKHNATETAKTWKSIKRDKVHSLGAGSVYWAARNNGWVCPADVIMNDTSQWEEGHHPAQALLDSISQTGAAKREPQANIFVPDAFRQVDGVMGDFIEYTLATSIMPQPILALAGALCLVGVVAGRRYASPTDLRTNIMLISMAESGGGKDHARKTLVMAMSKAGLSHMVGGNKIASGSGLLTALVRSPSSIFQLDEFGQFLCNCVDKRRAPKHISDIWDNLTELATSASSLFLGAEYADQKERPRQDIIQPCCVVHATTVPGPFWKALQSGSLFDGSFARWLLFQSDDPIPDRNRRPVQITQVPERLIEGLKAIAAGAEGWQHGNLARAGASSDPSPYVVPFTDAAQEALDALQDGITARQRLSIGTTRSSLLARVAENIQKLALIKAISSNPANPVIDVAELSWAEEIITYCTETMLRDADRFVADNPAEAELKRVLDVIRGFGPQGCSGHDLCKRTSFLGGNGKRRTEILQELVTAESITVETLKQSGVGRPSVRYYSH
jgi:hypothetical protein